MFAQILVSALAFNAPLARPAGRSSVSMAAGKSASVPFLPQPEGLDGSMAGDVGFVRACVPPMCDGRCRCLPGVRERMCASRSVLTRPVPPDPCSNHPQDPLNLASSFDLKYMREAELKHGRLSMCVRTPARCRA